MSVNYSDNPDFNEYLDEGNKIELLQGLSYGKSEILFAMHPDKYEEALREFRIQLEEDLREIVWNSFPATVAYHFHFAEQATEPPAARIRYMKDTWEGIIFTLYALVIGEVRHRNIGLLNAHKIVPISNNQQGQITESDLKTDKLKVKLQIIYGILQHTINFANRPIFSQHITRDLLIKLATLQDSRNFDAHSTTATSSEIELEIERIKPILYDVLKQVEFLAECKFLGLTTLTTQNMIVKVSHQKFKGSNLLTKVSKSEEIPQNQFTIQPPAFLFRIYADWENEQFSLSPFIHWITRDTETYLCVYKQYKNNQCEFEPIKLRHPECFDVSTQAAFTHEFQQLAHLLTI